MSQINNILTTTFRAREGGVIAQLGSYAQGFGNISNKINENTRMSERLNNQWRAIGTTIRYAIAGTAVFGLTRMAGQLKDIGVQMGLIAAIGEQQGGAPILGKQLTDLMTQARTGAVQSITPVSQYNDAIINLLSTIQNIPRDEITPIVTDIARSARLAQVSAEDATKAFTTMNVAFGDTPNFENIHRMAQEFFILTREAPGGIAAGQQVITQLGQLAQVTRAANGKPEDMFGLALSVLRAGIPPQQAGRGLQYLIQTVAFPGQQSKDSRSAMAAVGITPTSNLTLQQRLGRIFAQARKLGVHGDISKLNKLDDDTLADLDAAGDTSTSLQSLGITGGGAQYLGRVFHRIHALRTALALEGQVDVGQAQKDLKTMEAAAQGHVSEVNDLSKAWLRFKKQAKLQEGTIALNSMALQVATIFEPVLNFAAAHATGLQQSMARHPEATKAVAIGGASMLAALGASRFLGFKGLAGLGGKSLVTGMAVRDVASQGLGASPENPFYVIVVGQLFGGGSGGGSDPITKSLENVGKGWLGLKGLKYLGRASKGLVKGGEEAVTKAGLRYGSYGTKAIRVAPALGAVIDALVNPDAGDQSNALPPYVMRYLNKNYPNMVGVHAQSQGTLKGKAEIFLTLDINQGGKITRKKVHIPMDMLSGGRVPLTGGKVKSTRGT